jgi:hypothetical protein
MIVLVPSSEVEVITVMAGFKLATVNKWLRAGDCDSARSIPLSISVWLTRTHSLRHS